MIVQKITLFSFIFLTVNLAAQDSYFQLEIGGYGHKTLEKNFVTVTNALCDSLKLDKHYNIDKFRKGLSAGLAIGDKEGIHLGLEMSFSIYSDLANLPNGEIYAFGRKNINFGVIGGKWLGSKFRLDGGVFLNQNILKLSNASDFYSNYTKKAVAYSLYFSPTFQFSKKEKPGISFSPYVMKSISKFDALIGPANFENNYPGERKSSFLYLGISMKIIIQAEL